MFGDHPCSSSRVRRLPGGLARPRMVGRARLGRPPLSGDRRAAPGADVVVRV